MKAAAAQVSAMLADCVSMGRPIIVAIDGKSGTGKSTFAELLANDLGASIVEGDDFFAGGTALRTDDARTRADICIDWRQQIPVLGALRAGQAAHYHPFDWDAFDGSVSAEIITVEPAALILFEGVYTARPELAAQVDLRILMQTSDQHRIARLIAREGQIGGWERQWHEAETVYFGDIMPASAFDLVIDC